MELFADLTDLSSAAKIQFTWVHGSQGQHNQEPSPGGPRLWGAPRVVYC